MPGSPTTADSSTRGGLVIVLFVFFVLAFALATGAQFFVSRLTNNHPQQLANADEIFSETSIKDLVQPDPSFAPEKVVALQLAGLAQADLSAGIQQCFVLASPSNKQMTGPVVRFAAMVRRFPYDAMIHHQLALIGRPILEKENAAVLVTLLDVRGEIHVFQFVLSKQHGSEVENCWMTDAVYPIEQLPAASLTVPPTAWHSFRASDVGLPWGLHG
jgi:hypothetical protein